jgi:nucleoid-associated protein YgaU
MNITVISGNLFQIAAAYMGDAMQWINIAQVNRIRDPMISSQTTLVIPTASSAFENGIASQ